MKRGEPLDVAHSCGNPLAGRRASVSEPPLYAVVGSPHTWQYWPPSAKVNVRYGCRGVRVRGDGTL